MGQFADWDVGAGQQTGELNRGGYDAGRSLVYQFESGAQPSDANWYGVKALQPASGARVTDKLNPDAFLSYLSDFSGPGPQPVTSDGDYASFIGAGPFTLAPGDSVTVGFAWLAGSELFELQATADAAQAAWDDFIVSVEPLSSATVPRQFALDQNYPNPFNPATEISYSLPRPAEVRLEIFNLLGQKVRSLLHHEKQAAGRCTVFWDGRDDFGRSAASGIYLYRITAGDFIRTMKMTLLK